MNASDFPHVTAILKEVGLISVEWCKDYDRDRGTAVHAATHLHDEDDLDWSTLDDCVAPRLAQWQRFRMEVGPEILSIEERVINEGLRYCGRLDRRVVIRGREGVLDIKGTTPDLFHGPQLAAYAACFKRPLARWNLYLSDDRYRLIERVDRSDWKVFVGALSIYNFKVKHGRTLQETV